MSVVLEEKKVKAQEPFLRWQSGNDPSDLDSDLTPPTPLTVCYYCIRKPEG